MLRKLHLELKTTEEKIGWRHRAVPLPLLLHLVQRYHPHRSVFQPRRRTGPGRPLGCRAFGPRNAVPTVLRRPLACPRFDAILPPPSPVQYVRLVVSLRIGDRQVKED